MKIFLKHNKRFPKNNQGFTLVELLVVFFIMASILAVVIPGYLDYSTKLDLQNLALDVALTIREAQSYGAGAKITSGGSFSTGYGVHFVKGGTSFILFENISDGNGNYNVYSNADKTIQTYTMKNGYSIDVICDADDITLCKDGSLDVVFNRPNPNAIIKVNKVVSGFFVDGFSGESATGRVDLISPDQATTSVVVESTGNISIGIKKYK
ncbi:MAG: type II secretion system protein [Acetobacterium woodii]|nr:type II secretion system protein [Acetobacterium woodii]